MKIDAHQHFWSIARNDYGWLTPSLPDLWRDFLPADLAPLLARHGIDKTILVQAAPTEAETQFLLQLAQTTPFVAGVVGWIDFDAPDALARVAAMAANPLLVGLRPMVQDMADEAWLSRPRHAPVFEAMMAHHLVFDALVLPRHLTHLETVVTRHPLLSVVIDHAAKPHIRAGMFDPWRADMARLAQHPNIWCKLSGLVTEAGPDCGVEGLLPVAEHLLAVFEPSRLIWGSDWPVVTLAAAYSQWHDMTMQLLAPLAASQRKAVFGGNAAGLYLRHRGRRE